MMGQLTDSQQRRHDMFMAEMQAVLDKYQVDMIADTVGYDGYSIELHYYGMCRDGEPLGKDFTVLMDMRSPLESVYNCCVPAGTVLPWE